MSPRFIRVVLGALLALLLVPAAAHADTVFGPGDAPGGDALSDSPIEVGMKIRSSQAGYITALRFYKQPNNTGTHIGHLWSADGQQLAEATFANETASGWQEQPLSAPVAITADTTYVVSYYSSQGKFGFSPGYFSSTVGSGALTAPAGDNGVYKYGSAPAFPNESWNSTNYWIDANFSTTPPSDTRPPQVSAVTPADGSADVSTSTAPTATFDEPLAAATVTTSTVTLKDDLNNTVAAGVAYDAATRKITLTPSAALAHGRTFTATVTGGSGGVTDVAGNPLAANKTWSFSTPAACPCSVFKATEGPLGNATADSPVEVGMKFQSAEDGWITALRFYKQPNNTGTHVGHLWSATGEKLAEVTFTNETASGWQVEQLAEPVQITKDTTYITSYYAAAGRFAFSPGFFSSGVNRNPLRAPSDFAAAGNGVYKYGPSGFPNATFGATNYWVDASFELTKPPDTRAPRIVSSIPAANAVRVPQDATVKVTFDEAMDRNTINTGSILLGDGGTPVTGPVTFDEATHTATLTASAPLAYGKTYTVTVKSGTAGVTDLAGNRLAADQSWSFSTPKLCPCSIFTPSEKPAALNAVHDSPLEVGVKFRSAEDGYITALRFYKQSNNLGTHIGHLWSSDGQLLASMTFANETASDWQTVELPNPVAVTKDTVYVASYYSPGGHFPLDQGYFVQPKDGGMLTALASSEGGNGVFKYGASGFPTQSFNDTNYWVDAVFDRTVPPDTRGPAVTDTTPLASASDVDRNANVMATFDEQLNPSTLNTATFALRGDDGQVLAAAVSYDAQTRTATLNPSAPLAYQSDYTATLEGGSGGVADGSGNTMTVDKTWTFSVAGQPPTEGPGGPILVLTDAADEFGTYYAEILRGEGLNSFAVADGPVTADKLTGKTTLILAKQALSNADVSVLTTWVQAGGNLIAMRPDKKLAGLLGLTDAASTLSNGYMKIDTGSAAGTGLESMTLQFHDVADRYTLNGASALATLYSNAITATSSPAVSLRDVGTGGGQAAAFTYDLARSVVYTRQGNPAWAGDKRDGTPPLSIRPDDLFYGAKTGDVQPDWVDPDRFEVPQADEQQRLLANMITLMNLDKAPLPRFWYLPRGEKAAIILTGDDHGIGGTPAYFDRLNAASPAGCSVEDWECPRATSYVFPSTPMTPAQANAYQAQGFEIALHLTTGCQNFTPTSLAADFSAQLGAFSATWPDLAPPTTNRTHCIVWSDWASQAKIERQNGIRFDTNYYYKGPPSWVKKPGLMTGAGFPQRFGDLDGTMIDVYQSMTQVSDEMHETLSTTTQIHQLLDNALGPKEYFGVFNVILHSDHGDHDRPNELVGDAQTRGVPVITSAQMLEWLDSRNGSSFGNISYSGNQVSFTLSAHSGARGLKAMLPANSANGPIAKLRRDGHTVPWSRKTIKGVDYVMFDGVGGSYTATYAADTEAPDITDVAAVSDAEGHATVSWTTDEPSTSTVAYGRTTALGFEAEDSALVTDHSVELTNLQPSTTYHVRVSSADAAGNSATAPTTPITFTTAAGTLVDSRTSEFAAGTFSGTYAGDTARGPDGELQLQPAVGDEFNGSQLGSGWITDSWRQGGSLWLAGGTLFADSGVAYSGEEFLGPRTIEFSAAFQPVNDQSVGLGGGDLSNFPYAIFTSGLPGDPFGVYALTAANPFDIQQTALPQVSLYQPHRFRIEWTPTVVRYYVDGAQVASHNVVIDEEMHPVVSDYSLFGASVKVDWLRMSNYATTGTFTSRTLDSGPGANDWQTLASTAAPTAGTSISFQTRSGDTRQPNAGWSAWQPVGAGGAIASPNARFLQYRATLNGSAHVTPTLQRVTVSYGAGTDQAPVTGTVSLAPASPRTNQTLTATVSGFSDPDSDPLTYHYEWFVNGTRIPGAESSSLNLSAAGNGDLDDRVRVEVYATDGHGAASDPASAKVTVANTPPTAGTVTTRPVPAATKDLMRAVTTGFADTDGDELSYQYQWLINNSPVPGATGATFNVNGLVQLNDRVDVDVTASDGMGGTSPVTRGGQVVTSTNSTPVDGTVSITPAAPRTNQVVTAATSGFQDPDGDPLTYLYTWKRNGAVITGATASTLDLSQAGNGDRGDELSVEVKVRDPQNHTSDGVSASATVATTDPTAGTLTLRPAQPAANDTVSATVSGFADVDGDALTYQYQWSIDGSAIGGATGRTIDLRTIEGVTAGDVVSVTAKALDGHGGVSPNAQGNVTVVAGNGHPVASFGFEEAAGDIAADQHGGNDGQITGATRTNAGRFGRALSFEDNSAIVDVADDTSLHLASAMTLEAWVKPTATTNWRTVIFKEAAAGPAYSLYANSPDADAPHAHIGNDGANGASGTEELDPSAWTHLAATYDGNLLRLYVDGVLVRAKFVGDELSDAPGPLTIGANHVWGEHYRGLIDEVRVYNRRLTREEIVDDMGSPVVTGTPEPPSSTNPTAIGKFDKPVQYPITPVHLALLSNGKVAMWDGFEAAVNSEHTWDPWTGEFDAIPTGRNLFCAGHITLTDGRLLVAGGHIQAYEGTKETNIFDPKIDTWTRGQDMAVARWYPTATGLPDGRVFVVSGDNVTLGPNPDPSTPVPLINSSQTLPEIYNPATDTWTALPSASRRMPLYPYMFVLPNGKLFDAGPDRMTRTLDLTTGQWSNVGMSPIDGQSAVMYRPGKILKSGTWSDPEFPGRQASNAAAKIDMTAATPAWTDAAPMNYRRSYNTLTVLPDGKVLTTGGQNATDGVDETTGVLPAEMWDPDTDTWTTMASSRRPRLYHSSAVLLPDARVLLAGGGAYGLANNEKSGEIYSPPYLFKGPRPTVTSAPDSVHYGQSFSVETPDASRIDKVSLIRMGTVTHNFDMDQRFMDLSMTAGSDSVTISGPDNANVAPPGWYMVFLIDDEGVPSMGQIVQVDASGDTQAPSAPGTLAATAQADGADLSWGAATDNKAVTEYRVFRSTTPGFTPSAANRIARVKTGTTYADRGAAAGTYHYLVRAVDKAGNLGPVSNQASATIAGDVTAPTVTLNSPTAAGVSGNVSLTATAADSVGVQSVQFKLDGQNLGNPDTTSPYSLTWDSRTATDGLHTLTAVARDASGNTTTSAPRTPRVHNTGVVSAYGFEETSGTAATDFINGFNGVITGATRVTDGRFGRALSFDGTGDWVTIADRAEFDLLGDGTLEAWIRPAGNTDWRMILTKENGSGGIPYTLYASSDTGVPVAHIFAGATRDAFGPAPLGLSTWTHLAMTWDGAALRLFIDGAEVAVEPYSAPLIATSGAVRIGGSSAAGQVFNGLIDEVRIFDHARTPAEISADMNLPVGP